MPEVCQEPKVYLCQQMANVAVYQMAAGQVAVYSRGNPHHQTPNEDAAALIPLDAHCCILAVADGMGGNRAGKQASRIVIEAVASTVQPGAVELVHAEILNGIEQANRSICDLELGAATTLALVQIQGHTVRPYHVGDSMILVTGQRGKVKLQTVSHSPVGYAVEAGLLDEHGAITHSDRHVVSNVPRLPRLIRVASGLRPPRMVAGRDWRAGHPGGRVLSDLQGLDMAL